MAPIKIIWDGAAFEKIMHSPAGPLARHVMERATIVKAAARAKAPRRTGCLQGSIVVRYEDRASGFSARIVSDTTPCSPERKSYSLYVEEGTRPHIIEAKNAEALSFIWHGERVFFKSINHPGTKAVHFMRDSLPLALT
jgi:hypothetical protein